MKRASSRRNGLGGQRYGGISAKLTLLLLLLPFEEKDEAVDFAVGVEEGSEGVVVEGPEFRYLGVGDAKG